MGKRASRCYFRGMDPQVRTFCIITIFETMFTVGSKKKQEHLYFQAACTLLKTGKELIVHWQLCNCYSVRYVSFTNENYNTTNTCQYNQIIWNAGPIVCLVLAFIVKRSFSGERCGSLIGLLLCLAFTFLTIPNIKRKSELVPPSHWSLAQLPRGLHRN